MILTQRPAQPYRSLQEHEVVQSGDFVEDITSGRKEPIKKGMFYDFMIGSKASEAREYPGVYDVVRHVHA